MAKKNTPDSQANMVDFVQKFARPQASAPAPPTETQPGAEAAVESQAAASAQEPEAAQPATQPAAPAEQAADGQSTSGKKKEPAAVADENASWAENYLKPVRTRKTKAIYVDEETHATLTLLTQEGGVGLADLLINITNNHFDTFRLEIREFLAERERLKKKKSRF